MCLYSRFLYARKTRKLNNSVNIVTKLPESTQEALAAMLGLHLSF